jgi:hypothetical protein
MPSRVKSWLKPDGRDEWRADQEAMMKHDMTEDSYVEQCSVEDDVTSYSLGNEDKRRAVDRAQLVPPGRQSNRLCFLIRHVPYLAKRLRLGARGSTLCERQFPTAIYDPFRVMILLAMR